MALTRMMKVVVRSYQTFQEHPLFFPDALMKLNVFLFAANGMAFESWEPRKRDPDLLEIGQRGLDVLALLVSIYGTTEIFVSEYRNLLAEKLINNYGFNIDAEVVTLELLKRR
jgi:hypothetical protein